jgi:hypothetical protein
MKFALLIRIYVEKLTNSFAKQYNSTDAAVYTVYGTEIYLLELFTYLIYHLYRYCLTKTNRGRN